MTATVTDSLARLLLEGVLEISVLLAAAVCAVCLLRRAPARVRARLLITALLAAVLLPVLDAWVPGHTVGLLPLPFASSEPSQTTATATVPAADPRLSLISESSASTSARSLAEPVPWASDEAKDAALESSAAALSNPPSLSSARLAHLDGLASLRSSPVLLAIWLLGSCTLLAWQALGSLLIWRITSRARDVEVVGLDLGEVQGCIRIRESDEIATPVTWGWFRPVVLLPISARSWPAERRELVLEHELAHVARSDFAIRCLARLVAAVYWFHPLVWWGYRRLVLEQELACDEVVIDRGHRPSEYASELLSWLRASPRSRLIPVTALEMARRSQMEVRLVSILDPRPKASARLALPAFVILAIMVPALAAMRPWQSLEISQTPVAPQQTSTRATASAGPETAASLAQVAGELARLEAELAPFESQLRELERGLEPSQAELQAIEESVTPNEAQLEALEGELEPFEAQLGAIEAQLEPFEQRLLEAERELEPIEGLGEGIESELEPLEEQLRELEESLQPHELELERLERELEPTIEALESQARRLEESQRSHRASRSGSSAENEASWQRVRAEQEELEQRLAPVREQMEAIHRAMKPVHQEMQRIHEQMTPVHERVAQVHSQMEPVHLRMQQIHEEMEPVLRKMQQVHEQMEPVHRRMQEVHLQMEPVHVKMQQVHERMEPIHRQMQQVHERMEPLHRRMQETHERLHQALRAEVRKALEAELAPADTAGRDLDSIAGELTDALDIRSEDGRLWLRGSRSELRGILDRELAGVDSTERSSRIEAAVERVLDLEAPLDSQR